MFIVAVYVDDIILAGESSTRIPELIQKIAEKFKIKDMGKLHHFLGVKIVYLKKNKIWIGQQTYAIYIKCYKRKRVCRTCWLHYANCGFFNS